MSSPSAFGTANEAFSHTLEHLIAIPPGEEVDASDSLQTSSTREALNYAFTLTAPLNRLTAKIPLHVAAARLIWMMSANNRVEDIAFYEPRVRKFSDDDLTVPGSNYGMRLRQPQAGLDQIEGVIDRIRKNPGSRRTAVVIYQACDAVRDSKDIPCAFGMLFSPRRGRLHATLIMRSNNAMSLLPFNIFEFSMLLEIVSIETGLEMGDFFYFAHSMHLFERDVARAQDMTSTKANKIPPMRPMPHDVSPLEQLSKLAVFEAQLRHQSAAVDERSIVDWCNRAKRDFHPYWAQFALLLLSTVAARCGAKASREVTAHLDRTLVSFAPVAATANTRPAENQRNLFSFGSEKIEFLHRASAAKEFAQHAERYETEHGPIGAKRLLQAQNLILDRLAARGETGAVSFEAFINTLNGI